MVFVLPACWAGALIRAQQQKIAAPSTSNNNEEREEHEHREIEARDGEHRRPEPPPPKARELPSRAAPIFATTSVAVSVVHPRTPFAVSVRRLL